MICAFTYGLKSPRSDSPKAEDIRRGLGMVPIYDGRLPPVTAVGNTNTSAKNLLGEIVKRFTDAGVEPTHLVVVIEKDSASWPESLGNSKLRPLNSTS